MITGGDSGIGRAVALAFAREGAHVLITHLPEERADAETTVRLIVDAGRKGVALSCDLREEEQCREAQFGRLDILVNNAAYQMSQPAGIGAIDTEQFDRVLKTNLYAMFWLSKMALEYLAAGGSIINTSSVQAYKPSPHLLDYAMRRRRSSTSPRDWPRWSPPRGSG